MSAKNNSKYWVKGGDAEKTFLINCIKAGDITRLTKPEEAQKKSPLFKDFSLKNFKKHLEEAFKLLEFESLYSSKGKGGSLATIPQLFGENSLSALSNKLVARGVESSNTVRRKRPLDLTGDDDVDEDADDILERKADSEDASSISLLMSNEEKMEKLYSITRNGIMTSANYPAVTYTYHDDDPTESPNKIFILYALPSGVQSASSELLDDGTMIKVSYDWPSTLTDTAVLFPGGNYQPKPMGFNQALKLMGYEKTSRMRGYQIIPLPEKASTLYDFKMKKGNEGCIYCEITLQIQSKVPTVKHETLKVT